MQILPDSWRDGSALPWQPMLDAELDAELGGAAVADNSVSCPQHSS
jgi:hypothetical protein